MPHAAMHMMSTLCLSLVPRLSCVGEKRPGTHCWRMLSWPRFSGILENLLHYTNLRNACHLLLCERCLPLTTLCVNDDEGAMKAISSSLVRIIHTSVCSIWTLHHVTGNLSLWSLLIILNEEMQTVIVKATLLLTSKPPGTVSQGV